MDGRGQAYSRIQEIIARLSQNPNAAAAIPRLQQAQQRIGQMGQPTRPQMNPVQRPGGQAPTTRPQQPQMGQPTMPVMNPVQRPGGQTPTGSAPGQMTGMNTRPQMNPPQHSFNFGDLRIGAKPPKMG